MQRNVVSHSVLGCAALVLTSLFAPETRADPVADNPELYAFTQPPVSPAGPLPGYLPPGAVAVRIMPSVAAFETIVTTLAPHMELLVVHAGPAERDTVQQFLQQVAPSALFSWYDAEQLDSFAVGDFGFVPVASPLGPLILDPKFDNVDKFDDAFSSRFALSHAQTCAFRPPLLLQRGILESNGNGVCLISTKVYSMNPGLNELQIRTAVSHYFGCSTVIPVQPLQGDGKGRIDTLFRFTSPNNILAALYDVGQDASNRSIMLANHQTLAKALPNVALTTIVMPSPQPLAGDAAWPSYLSFVVTPPYLLFPGFIAADAPASEKALEAAARKALQDAFPNLQLVPVAAATLLAVGLRLNSVLLPLPAQLWAPCQYPEDRCTSNTLASCGGCFDECLSIGNSCLTETQRALCQPGQSGCLEVQEIACQQGWSCAGGLCKAPPSPCDDMPPEGRCDGDTLLKCTGPSLIKVECQQQGLICAANADDLPDCVPFCTNDCLQDDSPHCSPEGTAVESCAQGLDGCLHWTLAECPSGVCQEGSCVGEQPDTFSDADADGPDASPLDSTGPEDQCFAGGFAPKTGCAATPTFYHAASPVLTFLFLLFSAASLVLALRRTKGV